MPNPPYVIILTQSVADSSLIVRRSAAVRSGQAEV